jgi:hypothetical protein
VTDLNIMANTQNIIASGSGTVVGQVAPMANNVLQHAQDVVLKMKLETDLHQDYNSSRENTQELMKLGKAALSEVLTIASAGQHPRFFEAAALMIKTLAETNMGFMDTQTKLYQIKKAQGELGVGGDVNIEKAVFVGTTAELLKAINKKNTKKGKTINIDSEEDD